MNELMNTPDPVNEISIESHRVNYEKHSVALPTFYEKNIGFMRMKNTGHVYERPFIKLVDLYTQLCRQLP